MLLLVAAMPGCTKKTAESNVPELISFDVESGPFSATMEAKFTHPERVLNPVFRLWETGGKSAAVTCPATVSGNVFRGQFGDLRPNVRYHCGISWSTSALPNWESPTFDFDAKPYPMPVVRLLSIEAGAYDAVVRFRFDQEEYLRNYYCYCWIEGTQGAYNKARTEFEKEGDEYVCRITELIPESFYEFHVDYSNLGAIGERFTTRFLTLPPPYTVNVEQVVKPSYTSAVLSATFDADITYTPCGIMFNRNSSMEIWEDYPLTPNDDRIEVEVTDLMWYQVYGFYVYYTVEGEIHKTDLTSFYPLVVPAPQLSSLQYEIQGRSVVLQAEISPVENLSGSGFILLDEHAILPDGHETWRALQVEVPPQGGKLYYVWESLVPGMEYGFQAYGRNVSGLKYSDIIYFTLPPE